MLLELRTHVKEELALHTSETLKQSSKDNSGDLSGYGSHQADAAETFDRDFALGILSNEQDALNEIEEAIYRIKDGTYGICEETGKPINKERLTVVPFTRFSLEGQEAFEKNNRKRRNKVVTGLFEDNSDSLNLGLDSDDEYSSSVSTLPCLKSLILSIIYDRRVIVLDQITKIFSSIFDTILKAIILLQIV